MEDGGGRREMIEEREDNGEREGEGEGKGLRDFLISFYRIVLTIKPTYPSQMK